jgi:hypothetical protein
VASPSSHNTSSTASCNPVNDAASCTAPPFSVPRLPTTIGCTPSVARRAVRTADRCYLGGRPRILSIRRGVT